MRLTLETFEARCQPEAAAVEDRLLRYVSSPKEHDLAMRAMWGFIRLFLERWRELELRRST
jgi:hypothetical protein